VPRLLVLWDVDHTLVNAGGGGLELYRIAFAELFGGEMPVPGSMAGRTERAIALEVLTLAGLPEPRGKVAAFHAVMAAHAPEVADLIREHGTVLPGAAEALAALAMIGTGDGGASAGGAGAGGAGGDGHCGRPVVQALLTGNIRRLAEVKLGALGLTEHLDLDVGTYGDAHEVRSELVGPARRRAALAYGGDFSGEATVLVGDTPLDVEAALVTGARAVAVATGYFSVAELTAAGAHVVLPDLTDTERVLTAVLGTSQSPVA
jgi:phosphoglycolate phosphatase-like HAD superfamily hydrolase